MSQKPSEQPVVPDKDDIKARKLPLRADNPLVAKFLNKKMIGFILAGFTFFIISTFGANYYFSSDSSKNKNTQSESQQLAPSQMTSNEAVNDLSNDYSETNVSQSGKSTTSTHLQKNVQQSNPSLPVESTLTQQFLEQQKMVVIKRAFEAREADLAFASLTIPNNGNDSTNSANSHQDIKVKQQSGSLAPSNPRQDDDNRQDDKNAYLYQERQGNPYLQNTLIEPASRYQLMAGTLIPGVMLTGINSDLPGQLVGQVSQNVFDTVSGNYLLIPQGTKVIGQYDSRIVYGQSRVLVVWTRLIMPDGSSINLEGMPGADLSGYAGFHDEVDNHYLRLLGGVVMGSLLGASLQIAQGEVDGDEPTFAELAAQGAALNINSAGQAITQKNLTIQPTLVINPGYRFNIYVTKDVVLRPYQLQENGR